MLIIWFSDESVFVPGTNELSFESYQGHSFYDICQIHWQTSGIAVVYYIHHCLSEVAELFVWNSIETKLSSFTMFHIILWTYGDDSNEEIWEFLFNTTWVMSLS